jgi:hypothetical protein
MDAETLKLEVFEPVANRVKGKRESLKHVRRFERSGIEGWFKVEAVAALGDRVVALQNKGPDLRLCDVCVELKAATDCNTSYILGKPRYRCPVLFLGSSDKISACMERLKKDSQEVSYETFSDGKHEWVVGLIIPADYDLDATGGKKR